MGDFVKINLARLSLVAIVLGSVGGAVIWCAAIPYRIEAAEKRIDELEKRTAKESELLTRIDERTAAIQKWAERTEK